MNILIYGHRKTSSKMYDISTLGKELAAYLLIFQQIDKMGCYADLDEIETPEECKPCSRDLHEYCVAADHGTCACTATKNCKERAERFMSDNRQSLTWKKWYDEAKAGNGESAKKLLRDRSHRNFEYEEIETGSVINPEEKVVAV
jgi:hypothetical protein